MIVLRRLLFVFLLPVLMNTTLGQEQYYIYIQSDEHRSFYVQIGEEIYNSSGTGYLVIPNLEKNTYQLLIGYTDDTLTEWRFNCSIHTSDLGFVLKKNKNSGMQLLNLKRQEGISGILVQRQSEKKIEKHNNVSGPVSNDPFSSLLSEVVNDPSIRNPIVVQHLAATPVKEINDDSTKSLLAAASPKNETDNLNLTTGSVPSEKPSSSNEKSSTNAVKAMAGSELKKENIKNEEPKKTDKTEYKEEPIPNNQAHFEPYVVKETPMVKKENNAEVSIDTMKEADKAAKGKETSAAKNKQAGRAEEKPQPVDKPKEQEKENKDLKYLPFEIAPFSEEEGQNNEVAQSTTSEQKTSLTTKNKKPLSEERKENKEVVEEVKYLPFAISPESTQDPVIAVTPENKSSSAATVEKKENAKTPSRTSKPAITENKSPISSVRKTLERKSREGVDLIFIDESPGGSRDTIRIFIPNNK